MCLKIGLAPVNSCFLFVSQCFVRLLYETIGQDSFISVKKKYKTLTRSFNAFKSLNSNISSSIYFACGKDNPFPRIPPT